MGIRDTVYYGWQDIVKLEPKQISDDQSILSYDFQSIYAISGTIYAGGYQFITSSVYNTSWKESIIYTNDTISNNTSLHILISASDGIKLGTNVVGASTQLLSGTTAIISDVNGSVYAFSQIYGAGGQEDISMRVFATGSWGANQYSTGLNTNVWNESIVISSSLGRIYATNNLNYPGGHGTEIVYKDINGNGWNSIGGGVTIAHYYTSQTAIDNSNGYFYTAGRSDADESIWYVHRSTDSMSTFVACDFYDSGTIDIARSIVVDHIGSVYVAGNSDTTAKIRKSADRGASWDEVYTSANKTLRSIACDSNNNIYALESNHSHLLYSADGGSNWSTVELYAPPGQYRQFRKVFIDTQDNIYLIGSIDNKSTFIQKGKRSTVAESLGPKMLSRTFKYVVRESPSGSQQEVRLNNISEFPHSSGLYQIPNMVLGTTDTGRIAKNIEDGIVSIRQYGSIVYVMWPKQEDTSTVIGCGDLSLGSRSGKLTIDWQPGDFYNVEDYDYLSLYGYGLKQASGSLDNVLLRIEKRPLRSVGFAIDKSIEWTTSGSYYSEALYRDAIHNLSVDYSDLSIKEITWPIYDIPLADTKDIRVSVKFKKGQSEDLNKNFIVYGRLRKENE